MNILFDDVNIHIFQIKLYLITMFFKIIKIVKNKDNMILINRSKTKSLFL
jgi:hypothetical protein